MNLDEFLDICEAKVSERGHEDYFDKNFMRLEKEQIKEMFDYTSQVVDEYFTANTITELDRQVGVINKLLVEAYLHPEKLERDNDKMKNSRGIYVGALTTIGERVNYDYQLSMGVEEPDAFDVPECLDYVGLFAQRRGDKNPRFRFVNMRKPVAVGARRGLGPPWHGSRKIWMHSSLVQRPR